MTSLTAFGINRQRLTILAMLVIPALGAGACMGFPKREDPVITVRTALVTVLTQGLPLVQIEDRIAAVFRKIEALSPQMPQGSTGPLVNTSFGDVAIATVAVGADLRRVVAAFVRDQPLGAAGQAVEAARKRFRPILLTSLTTVLGLLPMAIGGGALWEPVATLMIGGLGVSSIMTLVYVPALYRVLFRDVQKPVTRQRPKRPDLPKEPTHARPCHPAGHRLFHLRGRHLHHPVAGRKTGLEPDARREKPTRG